MLSDHILWKDIKNKCLIRANAILDSPTVLPESAAKTVNMLVETAISMDRLDLLWAQQAHARMQVLPNHPFGRTTK